MKRIWNTVSVAFVILSGWMFSGFYLSPQEEKSWIAPASADSLHNPVPFNEKNLAEARKIYNNVCWTCHGLDGKGDGPASAKCKKKPADHTSFRVQDQTDGAIFWKISIGNGDMQSYAHLLTMKQRWMLVNYIRTFSDEKVSK